MIDFSTLSKTLNGKPIAVFGLGKSGIATINALYKSGTAIIIGDDDPEKARALCTTTITPLTPNFSNLSDCAFLILSPGIPLNFPEPHPVVTAAHRAGVKIIGDIELFSRINASHKTIGITGTNGKSTTTALIAHILNSCGKSAIACGNIGTSILSINPTPDMIYVIEMSSFQIDLCSTFRPNIAVHLNITPDHIDRHGTIENYIAIKERIFEGPGIGFCGIDDDASSGMMIRVSKNNPLRRMTPVSVGMIQNNGITVTENGDLIDRTTPTTSHPVFNLENLPTLRGAHNAQNAAFAYAVSHACGCSAADILNAMITYPGLTHRQLNVAKIGAVDYINDSKATNADATEKALKTFDHIHWIVGGLQKQGGLSGLEPYTSRITRAYLIGSSSDDFARFMDANHIPYERSETLDHAVKSAHINAQRNGTPGTVLLSPACASYDQFKSYEHRGDVFTALVQSLLQTEK